MNNIVNFVETIGFVKMPQNASNTKPKLPPDEFLFSPYYPLVKY
jgi:hypothetical protein